VGYSDQAISTRRQRGEPKAYDFRRPVRLARDQAHLLRVSMTTFGRQASTVLTTSLRVVSQLTGVQLEELSYDEYLSGIPDNTVCAVLTLEPLPGRALLTIDHTTLLAMVDHILGGPGAPEQPERPLSDIEQALVRHVLARMLRELAYALEPVALTTPELVSLESNAQFVQAAAATDPVVVARMTLLLGERTSEAALCLPYAMLGPTLEQLSRDSDHTEKTLARQDATRQTSRRLSDVSIDVSVRFDPMLLPSSQVGALAVGDVLRLGHRTTAPLSVTSANSTFAYAVPGTVGKQQAVLIVTPQ
jgi:flagellar motor switch protein FliM